MKYRIEQYIRGRAYGLWFMVCECETLEEAREAAEKWKKQGERVRITDMNGRVVE